jgi:hypothetical protein
MTRQDIRPYTVIDQYTFSGSTVGWINRSWEGQVFVYTDSSLEHLNNNDFVPTDEFYEHCLARRFEEVLDEES